MANTSIPVRSISNQGFLKNLEKYNEIKLSRRVFLDSVDVEYRDDATGVSSTEFGFYWYMLPKGKAIFKTYSGGDDELSKLKNIRITNELLCYEISKQIGIRCAEYELAEYQGVTGVVSYDVSTSTEKLVSAAKLFYRYNIPPFNDFSYYVRLCEKLEDNGFIIDKRKMIVDLFKIALFDVLTIQADRHRNNIFFLVNPTTKVLKIAPVIDNEFAFNGLYFDTMLYRHNTISQEIFSEKSYSISKGLLVTGKDFSEKNILFLNIKHLVNLAKQDQELGKIFKYFVSNYDVEKAINKVEVNGLTISKEYKEYLIMTEKFIKQLIKKELEKPYDAEQKNNYDFML